MKTIKVAEATGPALDWLVAKASQPVYSDTALVTAVRGGYDRFGHFHEPFNPSTDWAQGGRILDREMLCVGYRHQADPDYCLTNDPATICWARTTAGGYLSYGPTPLIAAMRCYIASKLGDTVEVPEELTCSPTPKND